MKRLILIIIIALFLTPALFARDESVLARVTVYWAKGGSGSDRDTRNHKTSTGKRLRTGHCAVDPRRIPYGSRVVLPNGDTLSAVDTGGAVKNRKAARKSGRTVTERDALVVDRFFETKGQALSWARTHPAFMPIRVVRPGSQVAAQQLVPVQVQVSPRTPAQSKPRSKVVVAKAKSVPADTAPISNSNFVASSSTATRNPFNRLGR